MLKELRDALELYALTKEHLQMLNERNAYYTASRGDTNPSVNLLILDDEAKLNVLRRQITGLLNDALTEDPKLINRLISALENYNG